MNLQKHIAVEAAQTNSIKDQQIALTELYTLRPEASMVTDKARTRSKWSDVNNPLDAKLYIDKNDNLFNVGVHYAVGGDSNNSTPGDILCGALAACLDSSIRLIAQRLGVQLKKLNVDVEGKVDVRGTLQVDKSVPVAFQSFDVLLDIQAVDEVPEKKIDLLIRAAEASCVVLQTLRPACEIVLHRGK